MSKQETIVKRIEREIRDFLTLMQNRKGIGTVVVILVLVVGALQYSGAFKDYGEVFSNGNSNSKAPAVTKQSFNFDLESSTLAVDVSEFCQENCQGNRTKGVIKAVTMEQSPNGDISITVKTLLKSQIYAKLPGGVGGGSPPTIVSADVDLKGKVDIENCTISIDQIEPRGDMGKVLKFASSFFSKSYEIQNCNELRKRVRS